MRENLNPNYFIALQVHRSETIWPRDIWPTDILPYTALTPPFGQ